MNIVFSYASYRFTDTKVELGGEELVCWELISRLAERGHTCHVFSPLIELSRSYNNIIPHYFYNTNYKNEPSRIKRIIRLLRYNRKSRAELKKMITNKNIDVVHHLRPAYKGFFSSVADLSIPFVYGPAQVPYDRTVENARNLKRFEALYSIVKKRKWRKTLKSSENILVSVDYAKIGLPDSVQNKIVTVKKGVDSGYFKPQNKDNSSKKKLKVLFLAAIRKNKGAHVLLRAIPKVLERIDGVEFEFVGENKDKQYFESIIDELDIHDYVRFTGAVSHEETADFYNDADLYCFPALQEDAPSSLLEAMACGLPVVASNIMGIPEFVDENENGFLFQNGDHEDLALKLYKALSNPKKLYEMGLHSRKKVEKELNWEAVVDKIERVYEDSIHSFHNKMNNG